MELSSVILNILVCPLTGGQLVYDRENKELISHAAGLAYPIIDGIPIVLVDKARKFNDKASSILKDKKVDYISSGIKDKKVCVA